MIGRNRKGAIMTTNDRCTPLVLIRSTTGNEKAAFLVYEGGKVIERHVVV